MGSERIERINHYNLCSKLPCSLATGPDHESELAPLEPRRNSRRVVGSTPRPPQLAADELEPL